MTTAEGGALIGDARSGLFTEEFLQAILPTRVATARRSLRQLGLVLADVVPTDGEAVDVAVIGELVRHTLRDSDIACRLAGRRVAMVLEFTPVEGCVVVAERLGRALAERLPTVQMWAGVACYPAHAIDDGELRGAAERALTEAHDGPPGTVVVAPVAD